MNQRGFVHIVAVIVIGIVAALVVSAGWYYHEKAELNRNRICCGVQNINANTNGVINVNSNVNATMVDTSDWPEQVLVTFSPEKLNQPYVLYVISTKDGSVLHRIETGVDNYEVNDFFLGGDKVYYYSLSGGVIKTIDFSGNIETLDYTDTRDGNESQVFVVSPSGSKIVRTEHLDEDYKSSEIYIFDTKTEVKEKVYEKSFDPSKYTYLSPVKISSDNSSLYFTEARGEVGGYIIFSGFWNLYQLNTLTGEVSENLFSTNNNGLSYATDIRNSDIVYFSRTEDDLPVLHLMDISTGEEVKVKIANNQGFTGGGAGKISPDGTKVAFNIAHWDSEDEHYRTMLYNVTTGEVAIIGDYPDDYYKVQGWINDSIFFQSQSGSVQFIDTDGNVVYEITE